MKKKTWRLEAIRPSFWVPFSKFSAFSCGKNRESYWVSIFSQLNFGANLLNFGGCWKQPPIYLWFVKNVAEQWPKLIAKGFLFGLDGSNPDNLCSKTWSDFGWGNAISLTDVFRKMMLPNIIMVPLLFGRCPIWRAPLTWIFGAGIVGDFC